MFTKVDDIYDMLNHITGESLMTHHLPTAMEYLKKINPHWYRVLVIELSAIAEMSLIKERNHEQFLWIHGYLSAKTGDDYAIPQLNVDEMKGFGEYMLDNSLLKTIGSKVADE